MIIGFDGSEAFVTQRTGVENYAYQLLLHLSKVDHENTYIIYLDPRSNVLEGDWPSQFHFKWLHWPFLWTQLGLALHTYSDRLDLLFIPAHTLPLLKNPTLKSVITVHDLGAEYLGSMHSVKQRLYLGLMTKYQLHSATKLIAVSQATKKDVVQRAGVSSQKIVVIYEGYTEIKADTKVYRLKYKDIEKNRYFLFVSTIQPRKNIQRLIEAYAQKYRQENDPPKLVLAGAKGWLSDPIYHTVEKEHLQDKVLFLGRVSDEDLAALYQNALAFVYPSLFEGFGLPILEAFSFQCPAITSNVSSMPEVAGDAAVLVDPYSVDEIGEALVRIEKDSSLRSELKKKGALQLQKFSWKKAAEETLTVFKEVGHER